MLWLGLALSSLYVPGYTGATVQTSWVVLSLALPAMALWRKVELTLLHWAVLAFVAISVLSWTWAYSFYDAGWGIWQVVLFALAFWLGSSHDSLRPLFIGFGLGACLSAFVGFAQALGYHFVLENNFSASSGLYYNSMYAGEIYALAIIGLCIYRFYWPIPVLVIALLLSRSYAGIIACFIGIVLIHFRSLFLLANSFLAVAVAFTFNFRESDLERLSIWYSALSNLEWFGNGPGAFLSIWFVRNGTVVSPEYVHNDFIQLVFEYGILAIVPVALLLALLYRTETPEWPIYVAFIFMAAVSFPLYTPILAFLGACIAGRLSRDWDLYWAYSPYRRLNLLPRSTT